VSQGRPYGRFAGAASDYPGDNENRRAGEAGVIPGAFEYHKPASLKEAVALLAGFGDDGRVLAGGHSLVPMMKLRLAQPGHLVDLGAIAELRGIRISGGMVRIGAMTTQAALLASAELRAGVPLLAETGAQIADPQVRYLGTIGGNVANGDPGNDLPAVMMALGARYHVSNPKGERTVEARAFYKAAYVTDLADGEILTAVEFPLPPAGHGAAYAKMKRKVGDYATAAAAVVLTMAGGRCATAAVALTNLAATPLLAEDAARALVGSPVDEAAIAKAAAAAMAIVEPASDLRGPAEFRTHVAGVMVRRAIAAARGRAKG
jgi:carbon-monoxide dehydrogenase medium subunit